jgi:uncharacterized protein YkwD
MKATVKVTMDKSIRRLVGLGLVAVMAMSTITFLPNVGIATTYAAESELTIRVGLPTADSITRSGFVQRYSDYSINYNGRTYSAAEFFDSYKGLDFGITRTTIGRNRAITVTLRENANLQVATQTAPAPAQPPSGAQTVNIDSSSQTAIIPSTPAVTATQEAEYRLTAEYASAVREEFYKLINRYRADHGLRVMAVNPELEAYADIRASELRECFSHTRPDGSASGSGWHSSQYAENAIRPGTIGKDPIRTATGIFNTWKNSPSHNRFMLSDFDLHVTMALGIAPMLDEDGFVTSGAIFAAGI